MAIVANVGHAGELARRRQVQLRRHRHLEWSCSSIDAGSGCALGPGCSARQARRSRPKRWSASSWSPPRPPRRSRRPPRRAAAARWRRRGGTSPAGIPKPRVSPATSRTLHVPRQQQNRAEDGEAMAFVAWPIRRWSEPAPQSWARLRRKGSTNVHRPPSRPSSSAAAAAPRLSRAAPSVSSASVVQPSRGGRPGHHIAIGASR